MFKKLFQSFKDVWFYKAPETVVPYKLEAPVFTEHTEVVVAPVTKARKPRAAKTVAAPAAKGKAAKPVKKPAAPVKKTKKV